MAPKVAKSLKADKSNKSKPEEEEELITTDEAE